MGNPVTSKIIPIQSVSIESEGKDVFSVTDETGKIYSRSVAGLFNRLRWLMVWVTQLVFFGLPWLQWNQRQAVLFDLTENRFLIFGLVLHPQDLIYLAVLMVLAALTLFFFTAVAGRLWCGYACPQTVYTEIYLWFERITEGDRQARMRLDAAPWSAAKIARKSAKQFLWVALGLFTGFTFVGYFIPIQELLRELLNLSFSVWEWFWVLFYGLATYANAGYLREQICKQMCPYARIQSALTDMDSMVIAYDTQRGESRGSRARGVDLKALGLGDCIDCTLCVQVCPTGIDIRNGLQNECIACAACIDVCDQVMLKMKYPKGLIRYSSGVGIREKLTSKQMVLRAWRPRVWFYSVLLLVAFGAFVAGLSMRKGFAVDVIKDRGLLARELGNGDIENIYSLRIMNATENRQTYTASVHGPKGLTLVTSPNLNVAANGIGALTVRLTLAAQAAQDYRGKATKIEFKIQTSRQGKVEEIEEKSTFFIPR
jgi:cytochrome c oxidase accessory protein FixG